MKSQLSIVILCGTSPRHLYVANRLCRVASPLAIVQEAGRDWSVSALRRLLRPAALASKVSRWLRDRGRYWGEREARFFFGTDTPTLDRPELARAFPHINDSGVLALCRDLQPDFIAVFGTSLIRRPLLDAFPGRLVNLHGGLSPHYRGADCTFWALYNGEPDQVGCTLHYIDPGIDTGRLIAWVCPEVREGDDELTLFWRAVRDSAEVYGEAFTRMAQGERFGETQSSKGRLYRVKDRLRRHERVLARSLDEGLLAGVDLPPRVRWFPLADARHDVGS